MTIQQWQEVEPAANLQQVLLSSLSLWPRLGYNKEGKVEYNDKTSGSLSALAAALGYTLDQWEVRHKLGGIAVSG